MSDNLPERAARALGTLRRELRRQTEQLNRIENLTPGRKVSDELERIALWEGIDGTEDAEFLTGLAERLRLLRTAVRGPGRFERDQALTRRRIAKALEEGKGEPFGD